MRPTKPLEDLIIAVFFSKCSIEKTKNGRELNFSLQTRKITYMDSYLRRHKLDNHIRIDSQSGNASIKESVVLEKILRDWTNGETVTAINPRLINAHTFLLWILLFGRKTKRSVAIDTNLNDHLRRDILFYFNLYLLAPLYDKVDSFYIKPYFSVLAQAIQIQRPAIENLELNYLLPEQEVDAFKKTMIDREGGIFLNGN